MRTIGGVVGTALLEAKSATTLPSLVQEYEAIAYGSGSEKSNRVSGKITPTQLQKIPELVSKELVRRDKALKRSRRQARIHAINLPVLRAFDHFVGKFSPLVLGKLSLNPKDLTQYSGYPKEIANKALADFAKYLQGHFDPQILRAAEDAGYPSTMKTDLLDVSSQTREFAAELTKINTTKGARSGTPVKEEAGFNLKKFLIPYQPSVKTIMSNYKKSRGLILGDEEIKRSQKEWLQRVHKRLATREANPGKTTREDCEFLVNLGQKWADVLTVQIRLADLFYTAAQQYCLEREERKGTESYAMCIMNLVNNYFSQDIEPSAALVLKATRGKTELGLDGETFTQQMFQKVQQLGQNKCNVRLITNKLEAIATGQGEKSEPLLAEELAMLKNFPTTDDVKMYLEGIHSRQIPIETQVIGTTDTRPVTPKEILHNFLEWRLEKVYGFEAHENKTAVPATA